MINSGASGNDMNIARSSGSSEGNLQEANT